MHRLFQILALAILLGLPQIDLAASQDAPLLSAAYHSEPLHWRQTRLFPRWEDTYVVVFEQEMLA